MSEAAPHFLLLAAGRGRRFSASELKTLTPTREGVPLLVQSIRNIHSVFPNAPVTAVIGMRHEAIPAAFRQHGITADIVVNASGEESPVSSFIAAAEIFKRPGPVVAFNADTLFAAEVFARLTAVAGNALILSPAEDANPDDFMVQLDATGSRLAGLLGKGRDARRLGPGGHAATSPGCFRLGADSRELFARRLTAESLFPRWHQLLLPLLEAGHAIEAVMTPRRLWQEVDTPEDATALRAGGPA